MTSSKQLVYTFTTIADATDFTMFEFSAIGVPVVTAPAINDRGQVALWGVDSSLEAGIFLGDGNSLETIADTSKFSVFGIDSSINDRGTVAFLQGLTRVTQAISPGTVRQLPSLRIVQNSSISNVFPLPTICLGNLSNISCSASKNAAQGAIWYFIHHYNQSLLV